MLALGVCPELKNDKTGALYDKYGVQKKHEININETKRSDIQEPISLFLKATPDINL